VRAGEADEILERVKEWLNPSDKTLKARVELAEGIWNTVMAIKGTFPLHLTLSHCSHMVQSKIT
jgi:hypothetical protein